ncbi:MAG: hypothetical protein ACKOB8_08265 [Mycobacterium sp.]
MNTIAVITGVLLIVPGALLIVYGVRNILNWMAKFDSSAIFESSFLEGPRPFSIPADGTYDIWIKVPRFKVNALADWAPEIRGANGGPPVRLTGSLFRTNMMRGSVFTMKVATFSAPRGTYLLGLVPAASAARYAGISGLVAPFERMLGRAAASTSWPKADPAQCHLQVRDARSTSTAWLFKGILPILLGAWLVFGGLAGGAVGLARADNDAAPGPQCDSGALADFTRSFAAAAAGSLNQAQTGLGVRLDPVPDDGAGEGGEYRGRPLPGSAYATLIESIDLRVDPQRGTIAALVATMQPDVCYSMPSVTAQFGKAAGVDIPPSQTGKTIALRYPVSGHTLSFGFGPSPEYRLVSVSVLL